MSQADQIHLNKLKQGNAEGLNALFKSYYRLVCTISFRMTNDQQTAEDIGQEVFMELWSKREKIEIKSSVKAYLSRAASNKTLNFIRDQKIKLSDSEELEPEAFGAAEEVNTQDLADLNAKISKAIQVLPTRCRLVFLLSRDQHMSYQEIAEALDISIKTVENQISKALKILRNRLGPYVVKMLILGITALLA